MMIPAYKLISVKNSGDRTVRFAAGFVAVVLLRWNGRGCMKVRFSVGLFFLVSVSGEDLSYCCGYLVFVKD